MALRTARIQLRLAAARQIPSPLAADCGVVSLKALQLNADEHDVKKKSGSSVKKSISISLGLPKTIS